MVENTRAGTAAKKKGAVAQRRRRRVHHEDLPNLVPLILISLLMMAVFKWQVSVLMVIFLAPTFVISLTSLDSRRNERALCVAMMNLAGIVPYAAQLWDDPGQFLPVASNVLNVTVMLGAAAAGYLFLWVGPIVAAIFLQASAADKLKNLTSRRKQLVEQWGPEVLGELARTSD